MGAGHDHAAGRAQDRARLRLVLLVTAVVAVVELVGAGLSGSLALLADAGHMLTDTAAIVLALSASYVATLPATPRRTFGYHRAEILAALINAVVLLGVCGYLLVTGARRLVHPTSVDTGLMLAFALVGLVANLVSVTLLASRSRESLNMRGAFLEVVGDTIGSAGAVVAALVIATTGFTRADPIVSLLDRGADPAARLDVAARLRARAAGGGATGARRRSGPRHLAEADGVTDVHDLHAWSITSGMPALSAHVTVTEEALAGRGVGRILDELGACVAEHFGIEHATFQVEPERHQEHEPGEPHA